MKRLLALAALGLLLLSTACTSGVAKDSYYSRPNYGYDSTHNVSCYGSGKNLFCFQGLPNPAQPAKWEKIG